MESKEVKESTQPGVGLLSKALQILDLFQPESPNWSQPELVRQTSLNRSTANRLVRYLCEHGYLVGIGKTGRYSLGLAAVDLGRRASASMDFHDICQPVLEDLSRKTRETVILARYDEQNHCVVCIGQVEGIHGGLRVFEHIGASFPLHAGATSKAVLALLPESEQEHFLACPLEPITSHTIIDPKQLRDDLILTRKHGFSVSHQETYEGVVGISVGFLGPSRRPIGSVAIALPQQRINDSKIIQYGELLIHVADQIGVALGGTVSTLDAEQKNVRNKHERMAVSRTTRTG